MLPLLNMVKLVTNYAYRSHLISQLSELVKTLTCPTFRSGIDPGIIPTLHLLSRRRLSSSPPLPPPKFPIVQNLQLQLQRLA